MKASKFSDAQKAFILMQGNDGVPVAEISRKAEAIRRYRLRS
jgi:putative transposase